MQVAAIDSFELLHERAEIQPGTPLRRVPIDLVLDTIAATLDLGAVTDILPDAHLYTETREAAEYRFGQAVPAAPGVTPGPYTVGLLHPEGPAVYLPDDGGEVFELQLFAGLPGAPTARWRADGDFGDAHARPESVRLETPDACADGPCAEWTAGCGGDGCSCQKFIEEAENVARRLRRHPLVAVLKCHRS
jgi:hypothetical protein